MNRRRMNWRIELISVLAILAALPVAAQPLTSAQIRVPSADSWPSFNGDYSGRHYSTLAQINQSNIKNLSLAWTSRLAGGIAGAIVGGEGADPSPGQGTAGQQANGRGDIKATPLLVNGILYVSTPDNAYAVDARTGKEIWHYYWKTKGGNHIGNRGMAMFGDWLYFETPDNYVVSVEAATGKERWHKQIADVRQQYFSTPAPLVVSNHLIVGMGGDSLDLPAWLESRDLETGDVQWKWFATPRPGDPAAATWPNGFAMERGGGMPWLTPTYDPELNLLYVPTGNPQPVLIGDSRPGDNLWTESIVALNPDTGKLVWYFQSSPHDTHDWDATQTPVLFDAVINGQPRKLVAQASRNGMFFVLDRVTGKNIISSQFVESANWSKGFRPDGSPIPNPLKEAQVGGALVSPNNGGAANWANPSYSPQTGLFYVNAVQGYEIVYRDPPGGQFAGYGGASEHAIGGLGASLRAIDVQTGKTKWVHPYPGTEISGPRPEAQGGILSTAGGLLFAGGPSGHIIAYEPATGKILWHSGLHSTLSNAPITYALDGHQFLLVAAGDTIYTFSLQE
jgi:acido-empty-quinoprotein group A